MDPRPQAAPGVRGALPPAARALALAPTRALTRLRREPPSQRRSLLVLVLLAVGLLAGSAALGPEWFPSSGQVVPLLVGGLLLTRHAMRVLLVVVAGCLVADTLRLGLGVVRPGNLLALSVTAVIAYEFARSHEETGLGGLRGDSMLVELRRRLEQQGALPHLPAGWHAEAVVRPAGAGPFSGDFVVSRLTGGGQRLEVALVDVSGKGVEAGTRSLLLSGAMGGLLGSTPAQAFLGSANDYLVRQEWDEGFATAVHLVLDLRSGAFVVTSAGHPPVAHFDAGSGRWALVEAGGVALGLLPDVDYPPTAGLLRHGDALLLYTDGLVEVPGRDLAVGTDKLLGEAERLVTGGFTGGANLLVDRVAGTSPDDRGLLLLWRS